MKRKMIWHVVHDIVDYRTGEVVARKGQVLVEEQTIEEQTIWIKLLLHALLDAERYDDFRALLACVDVS